MTAGMAQSPDGKVSADCAGDVTRVDFLVIGAGIAGASAAFHLAPYGRVVVLERESQPGYHSTGRSVALYSRTYGHPVIRALTAASWDFFATPPDGFVDHPLLSDRGVLLIGEEDQQAGLDQALTEGLLISPDLARLDAAATNAKIPALRQDRITGSVLEPLAMSIDVHALHHGFLRLMKARGGQLFTDAEVTGVSRRDDLWYCETAQGTFVAPVLINAAGAWADELAKLAGVKSVGMVPKRRTVLSFDPVVTDGLDRQTVLADLANWPMVVDADERFYMKPESGRLLLSPADETPTPPCDAQPDDMDLAVAIDRMERACHLSVRTITHKWAGLRSFVADKVPVVGFDARAKGFFWLAGQGGYGIQTAPAMGAVTAALATGQDLPPAVRALGVTADQLSPTRLGE